MSAPEPDGVFALFIGFDRETTEIWRVCVHNPGTKSCAVTWVTADDPASTAEPWIDAAPSVIRVAAEVGTVQSFSFSITNKGTTAFSVTGFELLPSSTDVFTVDTALPMTVAPCHSGSVALTFHAPTAPPPPDGVTTVIARPKISPADIGATSQAGHNGQLSISAAALLPQVPAPEFGPPGTQFTPTRGPAGTEVVLNGANFDAGTALVKFGTIPAEVIGERTGAKLRVRVPEGVIPSGASSANVAIRVKADAGCVISDDSFKVLGGPKFAAPGNQINPKQGRPGSELTLSGSNFNVGTPQVRLDSTAAELAAAPTIDTLRVTVPQGLIPAESSSVTTAVTVSTDAGSVTSVDVFRVVAAPAFAAAGNQFTPAQALPNTEIILNGTNFNVGTPRVLFGLTPADIIATPSPNTLRVRVPAGVIPAGSSTAAVAIQVITDGGTATSTDLFRAVGIPAFAAPGSQLTPNRGGPGGVVLLKGTNFNAGTPQVKFGTVAAPLTGPPTRETISAIVPGASGTVSVTVTTDGGSAKSDDAFTILPAPKLAHPPFPVDTANVNHHVAIQGENLDVAPVSVRFDTKRATIVHSSADELEVIAPALVPEPPFDPHHEPDLESIPCNLEISTGGGRVTAPFNILHIVGYQPSFGEEFPQPPG